MNSDQTLTPLAEFALPWGKHLWLSELTYEGGLKTLRLRFREGKHRFTDVDIDAATAARLAELFAQWSSANPAVPADGEDDGE